MGEYSQSQVESQVESQVQSVAGEHHDLVFFFMAYPSLSGPAGRPCEDGAKPYAPPDSQ